jgi:hypothetical protein
MLSQGMEGGEAKKVAIHCYLSLSPLISHFFATHEAVGEAVL